MRIILTKLSDARHRMTISRSSGESESVELESRSFLLHDLAHYAVEAEARIVDGVYGLLEGGLTLAELGTYAVPAGGAGLAMAESLSAPLQSLYRGRVSREIYLEMGRAAYPQVVTEAFVEGALERLRRLEGQFKATKYGEQMELAWPPQG